MAISKMVDDRIERVGFRQLFSLPFQPMRVVSYFLMVCPDQYDCMYIYRYISINMSVFQVALHHLREQREQLNEDIDELA